MFALFVDGFVVRGRGRRAGRVVRGGVDPEQRVGVLVVARGREVGQVAAVAGALRAAALAVRVLGHRVLPGRVVALVGGGGTVR